jgi:hypothetical protein
VCGRKKPIAARECAETLEVRVTPPSSNELGDGGLGWFWMFVFFNRIQGIFVFLVGFIPFSLAPFL